MKKSELVLLIATTDTYYRAFAIVWWRCFLRYWPNCPWPVVFATEGALIECLPTIHTMGGGFNVRLLRAVTAVIERFEPLAILLLHEDFLIGPQTVPYDPNSDLSRCLEILRADILVAGIGTTIKDETNGCYLGWPEVLAVQSKMPGILPCATMGCRLYRSSVLSTYAAKICKMIRPEQDQGRAGACQWEYHTTRLVKEGIDVHLTVRRPMPDGRTGILNMLFGVGFRQGRLAIESENDLHLIEAAIGSPLSELEELRPLLKGEILR
jgi:hypothetical protein